MRRGLRRQVGRKAMTAGQSTKIRVGCVERCGEPRIGAVDER